MKASANYVTAVFACLLATGSLLWAASLDITDTVTRSFDVEEGGAVHLNLDYGTLEVGTHAESIVRVTVERIVETDDEEKAREILTAHDLEIEQDGADVYVSSEVDGNNSWWDWFGGDSDNEDVEVNVRVLVPVRYNVDFETGAGNVTVKGVEGWIEGETGAGNVTVENAVGDIDLSTGAGNVVLNGVGGVLQVETGAGNVEARIARPLTDVSTLQSGMGNVEVSLASNVGADVEANTGMGSVDSDFELNEESAWMSGSASGAVNGGGPSLELNAGMGSISIEKM